MKIKAFLINLGSGSEKFSFFAHEALINWIDSVEITKTQYVTIPDSVINTHMAENPFAKQIKNQFLMSQLNGFNDFLIHIHNSSKNYSSVREIQEDIDKFEIIEEIDGVLY